MKYVYEDTEQQLFVYDPAEKKLHSFFMESHVKTQPRLVSTFIKCLSKLLEMLHMLKAVHIINKKIKSDQIAALCAETEPPTHPVTYMYGACHTFSKATCQQCSEQRDRVPGHKSRTEIGLRRKTRTSNTYWPLPGFLKGSLAWLNEKKKQSILHSTTT